MCNKEAVPIRTQWGNLDAYRYTYEGENVITLFDLETRGQ